MVRANTLVIPQSELPFGDPRAWYWRRQPAVLEAKLTNEPLRNKQDIWWIGQSDVPVCSWTGAGDSQQQRIGAGSTVFREERIDRIRTWQFQYSRERRGWKSAPSAKRTTNTLSALALSEAVTTTHRGAWSGI